MTRGAHRRTIRASLPGWAATVAFGNGGTGCGLGAERDRPRGGTAVDVMAAVPPLDRRPPA